MAPEQNHLIPDIEAEIDDLHERAERCRKVDLAAKAIFAAGCIMLVIGFFGARPLPLVIATGAILGSIALLGSNRRTLAEIVTQLKAQEVRRLELIDGLELQPFEGPTSERLMANPRHRHVRSYEPTSMDGPRGDS